MSKARLFALTVLALTATPTRAPDDGSRDAAAFLHALLGGSSAPLSAPGADMYDPMLGSWDVDIVEYLPDGTRRNARAEWHFARVLGGRAIQDVFVIPGDPLPHTNGTTVRVFEPGKGTWDVTWADAISGHAVRFVARREGEDVVQIGNEPDGTPVRAIFSEMTPRSFRWRGELSRDGGKTWILDVEFRARRR